MKFVVFADLHLDRPFAWLAAKPDAARRRREALRKTLRNIVDLTEAVDADALLCAGDLYEHDHLTAETASFIQREFARLGSRLVYITPGNHDWLGPASLYHRATWSSNVHLATSRRLAPTELTDGLVLWTAAHHGPADTPGFLDRFRVDGDATHLALFHGAERGWHVDDDEGSTPHAPFSAEEIPRAGLSHAFVGHYHRRREADHHTYPGNPDPLNFGDDGQGGAVIVTLDDDGTLHRVWHRVATTVLHDVTIDVTGCGHPDDVRARIAATFEGKRGFARATLRGDLDRDFSIAPRDVADAAPSLDELVVRLGDVRVGYDLDGIEQEPTVRGQFVQNVRKAAGLTDEQKRRILITGLRALDRRDDLEVS